ncbi:RHS repeat domain-containing protein, partial [Chitinophaga sp. sic0106]|uniref:RHS repeat domain-containing protein n=1 Tax=Chitinophaga sp. sic0106 TaxID=2854785 RepID=UPI0027145DD3
PFGGTMEGISSNVLKGLNYAANRLRYNGIEHTTELGLNQYDAQFRNLDPQIGRWWQIDPKIDEFDSWTPYNSNFNNPIRYSDPKGDCPTCPPNNWEMDAFNKGSVGTGLVESGKSTITGVYSAVTSPVQTLKGIAHAIANPIETGKAIYNGVVADFKADPAKASAKVLGDVMQVLLGTEALQVVKEMSSAGKAFKGLTSANELGAAGKALTKDILQKQFGAGAEILEQVAVKMDGASMRADFVVVQDSKVTGVFESKVNGSKLSNGQKLFFKDGDKGVLTGANAQRFSGVTVDPAKVQTGVYRWSSKTGKFSIE